MLRESQEEKVVHPQARLSLLLQSEAGKGSADNQTRFREWIITHPVVG
jgi:hypothetical protein